MPQMPGKAKQSEHLACSVPSELIQEDIMIANVLLDLDGTLIDSNDAHAFAWIEALATFHIPAEFKKVRELIGMGGDQLLPRLCGISADSELGQKISQKRGEIFRQKYLKDLKPFPKARELVEKMISNGLQLVVASSASREDLQILLQQIGIKDLIENTTSADDVEKSKPQPDVIERALQKIAAVPQESVLLGDTPYDVAAAAKAGVMTIAFTCGGWDAEAFKDAIAVYENPGQLLDHYEDSALSGNIHKQILSSKPLKAEIRSGPF
jgi:HAD superfamily hydrolase (TIGR01509 family)